MNCEELKTLIESNIPDCSAMVRGDDGVHFEAVILADEFSGKNTLQRQRLVYQHIGNYITDGTIHALSFKTYTNQEWEQKCES